jgi:hypothetical protein
MVRVVKPVSEPEEVSTATVVAKFKAFIAHKKAAEHFTAEAAKVKVELLDVCDQHGYADHTGSYLYDFPETVEGYVALQKQRRVSKKLDEDATEELLVTRDLRTRCYRQVEVLDEDEVMACLAEGLLSEVDVEVMYPAAITWAFVPKKEGK